MLVHISRVTTQPLVKQFLIKDSNEWILSYGSATCVTLFFSHYQVKKILLQTHTHTQIHLAKWVIQTSLVRFSAVVVVIVKFLEEVRNRPLRVFLSKGPQQVRLLLRLWLIQDQQWEDIRQGWAVQWTDAPAFWSFPYGPLTLSRPTMRVERTTSEMRTGSNPGVPSASVFI